TGPEIAFSIFYLLPVMLCAWFVDRRWAIFTSLASAVVWFIADVSCRESDLLSWVLYWNALVRFGFFVTTAHIVSSLKQSLISETNLARTDYLTGVTNLRYFYELAETELKRARRFNHPLTLAYLDIDNFKLVNDRLGHAAGNELLQRVAGTIRSHIRTIDILARVGGDEFVILFPQTGAGTAQSAIQRIQAKLGNLPQAYPWPITFSIGVFTCLTASDSVDAMVSQADRLMYAVKLAGKNSAKFEVLPNPGRENIAPEKP
ncbi:MAG: diguanylate cyclase, partial [Deltaproteobacteria bacterium]|nr:diguanylate cyclase [Deltaproteobacteria bacterium]